MILYARKWIESDNYVKWNQLELQNQIPNMECSLYVYIKYNIYKHMCSNIYLHMKVYTWVCSTWKWKCKEDYQLCGRRSNGRMEERTREGDIIYVTEGRMVYIKMWLGTEKMAWRLRLLNALWGDTDLLANTHVWDSKTPV